MSMEPNEVWTGHLVLDGTVIAENVITTTTWVDGESRIEFTAPASAVTVGQTVEVVVPYARKLLIFVDKPASKVPNDRGNALTADSFSAKLVSNTPL